MHFMLACTQAHAKVQSNTFKIFLVCAYEPPKSNTREVHLQTKNNYLHDCQWKMACMAGRGLIFLIQL